MEMAQRDIAEVGFIRMPVAGHVDLRAEILRLKKEKNIALLAHYYQLPEVRRTVHFCA